MSEIEHESQVKIACRLLWYGHLPHEMVSSASDLPPEEVEEIAIAVNKEKYELMRHLVVILSKAETEIPGEDEARHMLFDALVIMNRLFYLREMGRGERADFKSRLDGMDGNELLHMLEKLPDTTGEARITSDSMDFMDRLYADVMRGHYDDLYLHDE